MDGSEELPEGWAVAKMTGVFVLNPPKPKASEYPDGHQVSFVPMPAVDAVSGSIQAPSVRAFSEVRKGFTAFRDDDVILAKITPCMENGKAAVAQGLVNGLGFGSTEFHVFRATGVVVPRYLFYFIRQESFRRSAEAEMTGSVGQKRVPADFLRGVTMPIPPPAEQRRIVAAVERILEKVESAREKLERVPRTMKLFRQAVLAAACSGRLTSRSSDDAIPDGWRQVHLGELLNRVEAGKSFQCSPKPATDTEWGVIKVSAMTWGEFDPEENKATLLGTTFDPRNEIRPGDLLLSRSNTVELAGATVLVRETRPRLLLSDKSLRLVPNQGVSSEWLWRALQAPSSRAQMSEMATGTSNSMRNISQEKLATIELLLPPFREQDEIVSCVSRLFTLADSIEQQAASTLRRVGSLTQSVLAKAFRGELVPTEAELALKESRSYEPASELIDRLRGTAMASNRRPSKKPRSQSTIVGKASR